MADLEFSFNKVDEQKFPSRKDENDENERFQAQEMSGGKMKEGAFKIFINRSDKRRGLVINSPTDLPALMMLLKRLDEKYNV